jgi:uncharacterized protein YbcI
MAIEIFVLDRPTYEGATPGGRSSGQLRAALGNAMIRIVHEHWGKGPTRARTYLEEDFVFCVLEEPLTTVERTLVDGGETDLVRELRLEVHEMVGQELAEQVRTLTGRDVLACHSQIVFDPDILFEIFVLGGPASGHAPMSGQPV